MVIAYSVDYDAFRFYFIFYSDLFLILFDPFHDFK